MPMTELIYLNYIKYNHSLNLDTFSVLILKKISRDNSKIKKSMCPNLTNDCITQKMHRSKASNNNDFWQTLGYFRF